MKRVKVEVRWSERNAESPEETHEPYIYYVHSSMFSFDSIQFGFEFELKSKKNSVYMCVCMNLF